MIHANEDFKVLITNTVKDIKKKTIWSIEHVEILVKEEKLYNCQKKEPYEGVYEKKNQMRLIAELGTWPKKKNHRSRRQKQSKLSCLKKSKE